MKATERTLRLTALAASLLAANVVLATAHAAPSEALDTLSISLGDYVVTPQANVSVKAPYGSVSSGDVSSQELHVPRLKVDILLGERQGFALDYYGFNRQYAESVNRSYTSGANEVTFTGNVQANAGLDLANASYKWWFGEGASVFGVGLGAAYYRIRFGVDGYAASNVDNTSGAANAHYSASTIAPLLQLGWRHAFTSNARMYVDLSGVEKAGGNLTGHIYNAALGAEWYVTKKFGVGLEYSATRIKIRSDGNNERLDLNMEGPSIFLKTRF